VGKKPSPSKRDKTTKKVVFPTDKINKPNSTKMKEKQGGGRRKKGGYQKKGPVVNSKSMGQLGHLKGNYQKATRKKKNQAQAAKKDQNTKRKKDDQNTPLV